MTTTSEINRSNVTVQDRGDDRLITVVGALGTHELTTTDSLEQVCNVLTDILAIPYEVIS